MVRAFLIFAGLAFACLIVGWAGQREGLLFCAAVFGVMALGLGLSVIPVLVRVGRD